MSGFEDQIEWDPAKAAANLHKHGVPFEIAATVFLDPLTRTVPDRAHSVTEERWITMGRAQNGWLLVVIHMWHDLGGGAARIRDNLRSPRNSRRNRTTTRKPMSDNEKDFEMEAEYDFSKAERGKFYRPGVTLRLPVYLNEELQRYLAAAAQRKGVSLTDLVNGMLSKEIEIVEAVK